MTTSTGAGTIIYNQTGNQTLDLDLVSTNDGDITIGNSGTTAANITIADGGISASGMALFSRILLTVGLCTIPFSGTERYPLRSGRPRLKGQRLE